jgi:hypothetical protein
MPTPPVGQSLALAAGYVIVGFVGLVGLIIIWRIWQEKININMLISEPNGDASMSRLQLLIFTVVIAMSLFLVIIGGPHGPAFPATIPDQILTLLGISGTSYLVSKGIQFSDPAGLKKAVPALVVTPATFAQATPADTQVFTAAAANAAPGAPAPPLQWSLEAPALGSLTPLPPDRVRYNPPSGPVSAMEKTVTLRVTSPGFEDAVVKITLA